MSSSSQSTVQVNDSLHTLEVIRNFCQLSTQQTLLCRQDFQIGCITTLEQSLRVDYSLIQLINLITVLNQFLILRIIQI